MHKSYLIALTTALLLASACEEESSETFVPVHGKGIVNGEVEEGFPSVVSLGGSFGGDTMSMCTGNLVTPRIVLSAAHCGDGIPIEMVQMMGRAYFGTSIDEPLEEIGFSDLRIHPEYEELVSEPGGDLGQFDLSVFVLEEDASAEPTWFRREEVTDDDLEAELTSVGFGITSGEGGGSGIKRSAVLTLDQYDENFLISYVENNPDEANICSGDSGGPQFFNVDGFWVQGAVHSWGDQNCVYNSGSTRTDIAAEWFLDIVEEVHGTRDVCEINGWYDNGVCEPYCAELDPDCVEDTDEDTDADGGTDGDTDTDTDTDGGVSMPGGDGCGCAVTPAGASPWSLLALLGAVLGILAVRR